MKKFLFLLMLTAITVSAAEPILKVGIISDTHIKKRPSSCNVLIEAMKLFKAHKVDLIVNTGDIADVYQEDAYKNYRNTVTTVFPDAVKRPPEIFVYAWHDRINREKDNHEQVFEDIKKLLGFSHKMYDCIKLKGYPFLVFPQGLDFKKYEKMIAQTCKENPDKPVFVLDHVPPYNTVYNSLVWGEANRRKILDKYPQVIHISGHVHGSLGNELNIWQDKFTAVNVGSLHLWSGAFIGNSPVSLLSTTSMIMEVYPDKLVFRRFFSMTKNEYQPDTPWVVPLPFDPRTAPYNFERRKAASTVPVFPKNTKITTEINPAGVNINFPQAEHKDGVFAYKIMFYEQRDGKWIYFSRKDIMGNFMHEGKKRTANVNHTLNIGYFNPGKRYRLDVIPVNPFGKEGAILSTEFEIKDKSASTVVFETANPMKDCKYFSDLAGGKPLQIDADGFYINNVLNSRLIFPDNVWDGKKGTKFRFIIDMHMKQSDTHSWTLVLRNPTPMRNANSRLQTPTGDSGIFRHVIEMTKQEDAYKYYLLIREGKPGKIRFHYVRIERIN